MSIVIGLDGGGTKTLMAAVRRDGTVVEYMQDAGCNPFDHPEWRAPLVRFRERGASLFAAAEAIGFGMPGYAEVADVSKQQDAEVELFGVRAMLVMNDVTAAFEGALCGEPGVLLLAGTGSMIWARSVAGEDVRVGGWGYQFGDEGSAFWIGREAVACVSHALDGRSDARSFADALFSHLGLSCDDPRDALIEWYGTRWNLRAEVAALARFVDLAAATEPEAVRILDDAAAHLARHVAAGWKAIGGEGPAVWSIAGGAFASARLRSLVVEKVGSPFRDPLLPPIGGALRCAALKAGWTVDASWISKLSLSLAEFAARDARG